MANYDLVSRYYSMGICHDGTIVERNNYFTSVQGRDIGCIPACDAPVVAYTLKSANRMVEHWNRLSSIAGGHDVYSLMPFSPQEIDAFCKRWEGQTR